MHGSGVMTRGSFCSDWACETVGEGREPWPPLSHLVLVLHLSRCAWLGSWEFFVVVSAQFSWQLVCYGGSTACVLDDRVP